MSTAFRFPARAWRQAAGLVALACCSVAAQAKLITFGELPWNPSDDPTIGFADQPVTDQYAAQGVVFSMGYLKGGETGPQDQYLLGGPVMGVFFTDVLPRHVSFDFSSAAFGGAFVDAYGPDGFLGQITTGGDLSQPTQGFLDVHASFSSPGGISYLGFDNYYHLRTPVYLDNLYYGAIAPVPEPASGVLMGAGLAGLLAWRRRRTGAQAG
jgi:hypothetical protein